MSTDSSARFAEVDIDSWYRKDVYRFFREFEDPFFNMTAPVDVTVLDETCRNESLAFSIAFLYCSQKALNSIEEFRMRLLDGKLVSFDKVEATQTILLENQSFGFCYFPWREDPREFVRLGRLQIEKYREIASFDVEADRLDLVYYSVIPWVSFTSFKHASRWDRDKTVPRIVFGKKHPEGGQIRMPVSVEVNHAIMDGLHVGRYFERLQSELDGFSSAFLEVV